MINKELTAYIKECRKKNFPDLEIRNTLIESGWKEKEVIEALLASMGPKKLPKWIPIVGLVLAILVIGGVIWAAVFMLNDIRKTSAEIGAMTQQIHGQGSTEFCGTSTNGQCSSDDDCTTGGCSNQVCQSKSEEPAITTCEYRDCYNASTFGVSCKCSENKCQWK